MCNEFLSEKEQIKENARNEVQNEIVNLKLERDNEIQKIYKRLVVIHLNLNVLVSKKAASLLTLASHSPSWMKWVFVVEKFSPLQLNA